MQKFFITFFIVCSFLVNVSTASQESAVQFIQGFVQKELDIVNDSSTAVESKPKALSKKAIEHLDLDYITKFVFTTPKYKYKSLSVEDQNIVKEYLTGYLLALFASPKKLEAMVGADLKKDEKGNIKEFKVEKKDKYFSITTRFTRNGKDSLVIAWITDGEKIIGVEMEGIRQDITVRSEILADVGDQPLMRYIKEQMAKPESTRYGTYNRTK